METTFTSVGVISEEIPKHLLFTEGCALSECLACCLSTEWTGRRSVSLLGRPQALPGLVTAGRIWVDRGLLAFV